MPVYPVGLPQVAWAAFLSFVITVALVFVIGGILKNGKPSLSLKDIILDDDGYPSLATFQFLVWTIVVIFAFLTVYLVRVFGHFLDPPTMLPMAILGLMGISTGVPVLNGGISGIKYPDTPVTSLPAPPPERKGFSTMLQEHSRPSLTRFQMFSWTWISVIIYAVIFTARITDPTVLSNVSSLTLPDIDPALVVLMGLSQGAYLGGKIVASTAMNILSIHPQQVTLADGSVPQGSKISVVGFDFGDQTNQGIVVFKTSDGASEYRVAGDQLNWGRSIIDVTLPGSMAKGDYNVIVVARGIEVTAKDTFKVA